MSADLVKRANAVRAEFKKLESVAGSGYHDNDRNPARNDLFLAPQKNGLPRASESLVAFFDHDDMETVEFVGPDAQKADAALKNWLQKNSKGDPSNRPGTERKLILRTLPRLKLEQVDGQPRLSIWLTDWNDVLYALQAEGVAVAGLPLEE